MAEPQRSPRTQPSACSTPDRLRRRRRSRDSCRQSRREISWASLRYRVGGDPGGENAPGSVDRRPGAGVRLRSGDPAGSPDESTNIYATSSQEVVGNADFGFLYGAHPGNATYYSPYHMHGSFGPSCAVANVTHPDANGTGRRSGRARRAYTRCSRPSDILAIPTAAIRVIYVEGAGCYGHNGSDDVAADAG